MNDSPILANISTGDIIEGTDMSFERIQIKPCETNDLPIEQAGTQKKSIASNTSTLSHDSHSPIEKEIPKKNLLEVREYVDNFRDVFMSIQEDNISLGKTFIDHCEQRRWSSLHLSVFQGHLPVVQELLKAEIDINDVTEDHWTPLQLAVQSGDVDSKHMEYSFIYRKVAKLLLENSATEVNKRTPRTSAFEIALKNGNQEIISLLFQHGANFSLLLEKSDTEILTPSMRDNTLLEGMIGSRMVTMNPGDNFTVRGWVIKRSAKLRQMNRRYCVLDCKQGTFSRYVKEEDYPTNPREVVYLKDVLEIKRKSHGFGDNKTLFYFKICCSSTYIFACHTQEATDMWILNISQAILIADDNENEPKLSQPESDQHRTNEVEISEEGPRCFYTFTQTISQVVPSVPKQKVKPRKACLDDFQTLGEVGDGTFGKVFKIVENSTGRVYALKAMRKKELIYRKTLKYAVTEASVLSKMNNPFILKMNHSFQTEDYLYLVLDYCTGGDLSYQIKNEKKFTEDEVRLIIAELILAIEELHSHNILYRDLKPENILIDADGHIRLADFSLSKEGVDESSLAKSVCGSPAYLSPEMVKREGINKAADIYGIGTILYELLTGYPPYESDHIGELYDRILNSKLEIPKKLSAAAQDLLQHLLNKNPKKRLGVKDKDELKNHAFFKGLSWTLVKNKKMTPPEFIEAEENFDDDDFCSMFRGINLDRSEPITEDSPHFIPDFDFTAE